MIARSDQGRLPIKREPVELGELLERVRDRFEPRAAEAGRAITVEAPPGAGAELDPLRIEQALGNLVDNALRHGAGQISLGAAANGDARRALGLRRGRRASRPASRTAPSSASPAPTRVAPAAAPGWAWRSCARSRGRTAARRARRALGSC